ncbi:MAG: DNA recombination protein RmuC [Rhodospirillales bacterium]|nr:DNA recombination protein RmuC [Rhodospirillales bacterium]
MELVAVAAVIVALAALVLAFVALRRGASAEPFDGVMREFAALKGEITAAFGHTHQRLQSITDKVAVIDSARANIEKLAEQVVDLNRVFGDKQARGAFGQRQMEDLVRDVLAEGMFEMQATLANGKRVDCLVKLPKPPGPIGVDAKFPLESFRAVQAAADDAARIRARKQLGQDVVKHVKDIAEKYIVRGETADWALMFVPSEAVYAEIHAHLSDAVEEAHRLRVGIVSPTTLMAALTTVRAVVQDAAMVERAEEIRTEVQRLKDDADRLVQRAGELETGFGRVVDTLRQVRISADKLAGRIARVAEADVPEKK